MNKFKKTLATALACALILGTGSKALADEANKTPSLFEILVSGENKTPSPEKKDDKETKPSYENDPAYQEEFKARYDLYNKILIAKDLREVDVTKFIDILNKKAAKNEDLEKVTEELSKQIEAANEKIALDLDVEGVKKDVKAYILHGNLFFLDKLDKKDIKNLYLFYESTVNSYGLARASEEEKKAITPVLEDIYNYILEIDEKVKTGKEITEEDKTKTQDLIEKLAKTIGENAKEDLSHQSTKIEKTKFLTSGNQVDGTLNENSAFYKSQRSGIKEAYQKLKEDQRTFLDNINTNNDDYIEDSEIKANGQYTLPLDDNNFIKPFYGKPEGNNVEVSSSEVAGQTNQTTSQPAQTPTTPQNPAGDVPETVTLSQGENTQGVKSEDAPTLLTKPASQVKTGIKGVGYLGIVLVVAIIAFVVLSKKKEDK
ncbi:DNA topoisomerase 2-like domain-containing protein [Anaerococcus degeneri]|uniref:Uncharacterized protein n=1 Tax=Anaerococcus degeneri TaxID=361500 RepID=A0ABS7YXX6_9FIRM|nr:hypothetical protein [Anaerococcus degeneri]MBP2016216.1 hypothetical protein [Anaerococcus degeneri]MCA2096580.1 hypothetical protein [Anaerococcus degeneri]